MQLVDGSGQTHQRKGVKIAADGKWHDLVHQARGDRRRRTLGRRERRQVARAARGRSCSPCQSESDEKAKQPVLYLADIRAEALLPVFVQPAAFKSDFEAGQAARGLDHGRPAFRSTRKTAFKGERSLVLSRTLEEVRRALFGHQSGVRRRAGPVGDQPATKSDLHSPDNSYNGVVHLECLDARARSSSASPSPTCSASATGKPSTKRVELPKGVATARFHVQLNKTYGTFWLDELSAVVSRAGAAQGRPHRARALLHGAARQPAVSRRPAQRERHRRGAQAAARQPAHDLAASCAITGAPSRCGPPPRRSDRRRKRATAFTYEATIDLGDVPLEIGRYYELHAAIPQEGDEPFRNYTSLAILPEAETKRFKPEEVPFTSRNWDNRITEYIQLTRPARRAHLRHLGRLVVEAAVQARSAEPRSVPEARHGLARRTRRSPPSSAARRDYDETALRQGVRNLIEKYGKRPPADHQPRQRAARHRRARPAKRGGVPRRLRGNQEGRSDDSGRRDLVEPNEEYFKAGYGKWCDAYDFHIYEDSADVRRTIGEYRALMKKYGAEKPIWSTELGLNSQGLTRHVVAVELIKKFATFFAAGGANVSWFGLLYPDPDGKSHGSSGDSHNVFDCRYNRYAPRLDAIAYYNAVNAIAIKKFVAEKQYAGGIRAFLFRDRDNRSLQVLWKDKGRQDVLRAAAGRQGSAGHPHRRQPANTARRRPGHHAERLRRPAALVVRRRGDNAGRGVAAADRLPPRARGPREPGIPLRVQFSKAARSATSN